MTLHINTPITHKNYQESKFENSTTPSTTDAKRSQYPIYDAYYIQHELEAAFKKDLMSSEGLEYVMLTYTVH